MNNAFWNNPVVHAVVHVLLIAIPFVLASNSHILGLTIGGVLTIVFQALKNVSGGMTMMGAPKR